MASAPTDGPARIDDLSYIGQDFLPHLTGTIKGTVDVPDGIEQFDPNDVTIYAWRSGQKMTASNAVTTSPTRTFEYVGRLPNRGNLGGNTDIDTSDVPQIKEKFVYDLELAWGEYVIGVNYDGPAKVTWDRVSIGPNDMAVATATLGGMSNLVRQLDFTLVANPDITFRVSGGSSIDLGDQARLSWDVDHTTKVTIEPNVGNVANTGATFVSPSKSTTYKLKAIGNGVP
jgi:hypothetical protein